MLKKQKMSQKGIIQEIGSEAMSIVIYPFSFKKVALTFLLVIKHMLRLICNISKTLH